mmetsp:Transcript_12068/g.10667  ORF Transcript_12068/g.10667 Transcript_12068/m.10667 type:complete len:192 (+) Transcript_12068:7-582(+)
MSFLEMANQHQRDTNSGAFGNLRTTGSLYAQKENHNIDANTMPFFESTIKKHYNPLVEKLSNKYDNIYNPSKTIRPLDPSIHIPSPLSQPSNSEYLNKFNSNQYNGTILSPRTAENVQLRSILKNPAPRKVSWADQAHESMPMPTQPVNATRILNPNQMSIPLETSSQQPKPFASFSSSGIYKPAIIPSNK